MIFFVVIFNFFFFNFINADDFSSISQENWNNWKKKLIENIEKKGSYKQKTIDQLNNLVFNPKVIKLDRNQPEFKLTFEKYFNKVVTNVSINKGVKKKKKNKEVLNKISNKYGVDENIIVSLWGIETFYGTYLGSFDILNSLATLIYDGRRRKFFTMQFESALDILDQDHIERSEFIGSWAGAFGHTQFMPTTFANYSVDFNNDGKKNLISDNGDALASGANYLSKLGWNKTYSWGERFLIDTNKIKSLDELIKDKSYHSLSYWQLLGFKPKKSFNNNTLLRLISVNFNNKKKNYFLVTQNFDIILNWNKSNYFALAVGILSDKIKTK